MASPAEAWPDGPEQYDLQETLLARQRAANFQYLYDAFILNRDDEQSQKLITMYYQDYLLTDPHGIATSVVLDKLTSDPERAKLIHFAIAQMSAEEDDSYVIQMLDTAGGFLPPDLRADILSDPHLAQDAA